MSVSAINDFEEALVTNTEWLKEKLDENPVTVDLIPYEKSDFKTISMPRLTDGKSRVVSNSLDTY